MNVHARAHASAHKRKRSVARDEHASQSATFAIFIVPVVMVGLCTFCYVATVIYMARGGMKFMRKNGHVLLNSLFSVGDAATDAGNEFELAIDISA